MIRLGMYSEQFSKEYLEVVRKKVSKELQDKIFERFYRVDKARSRAAGGFGLGLNIARIIVVRHGGTVSVKPRSPHGSIFTVRLPLYR